MATPRPEKGQPPGCNKADSVRIYYTPKPPHDDYMVSCYIPSGRRCFRQLAIVDGAQSSNARLSVSRESSVVP